MMIGCWALALPLMTTAAALKATATNVDWIVLRMIGCTSGFLPWSFIDALIGVYGPIIPSGLYRLDNGAGQCKLV
jgi:hypothetical protein